MAPTGLFARLLQYSKLKMPGTLAISFSRAPDLQWQPRNASPLLDEDFLKCTLSPTQRIQVIAALIYLLFFADSLPKSQSQTSRCFRHRRLPLCR